jgi:hypothetical protein
MFPLRQSVYPLLSDGLDVQSFITFFCINLELLELNYEEDEPFHRRSLRNRAVSLQTLTQVTRLKERKVLMIVAK